jgi:transcriptional regulator with GAF, ATPase, and Fis domain
MPHNLPNIIGCSAAVRDVLRQVGLVAPTEATVLIQGKQVQGKRSALVRTFRT